MCGIFASVNHPLDDDAILRAVESLRHRGPDGTGVYTDPEAGVGLGHTRLSIIDVEGGAQPLFSEDGSIVLVCNGEIYDFERIRAELESKGHAFATHSDSEVIVHLYEEYGLGFTEHLRGEFAFVLYDKRAGKLIALRDRFGIKPIYMHGTNGKYLFASEAKAIFATGQVKPAIDVVAVRDYLSGAMPDSIFEEIGVVPPGCAVEIDLAAGDSTIRRYWDLDLPAESDPPDDARDLDDVREEFDEAVKLRLRADVPVGVYLSGGIDSAIVAGTVAKFHDGPVKAFNIAFPDDEAFNEFALSKEMAEKIGAEFHSVTCTHEVLLQNTEDALWVSEYPFLNFHGVGKHCLSQLAAQHVKVVLTGEGSDETFLGYLHFQPGSGAMSDQLANKSKVRKAPGGWRTRRLVNALGFVPIEEHVLTTSRWVQTVFQVIFNAKHAASLRARSAIDALKGRIDRKKTDALPLVRRIQHFGIKAMLTPYILGTLGDRAEMGHSIEGRTPFLDHRLFERARRMPDSVKIRGGVEKFILREAFRDRITASICNRKKWPYSAPPLWIRRGENAALDGLLARYCSRAAMRKSCIFNYWFYLLLQIWSRVLFFDSRQKRQINLLLTFVFTVQILDHLYVQNFEQSLAERVRAE
jgi:asparagine synthase (glutamine-hydrolysing)